MKSLLVSVMMVAALSACAPAYPKYARDQQARQRIFKECMASLPAGPASTKYNDWNEVVSACDDVAYYQSQVCVANCSSSAGTPR